MLTADILRLGDFLSGVGGGSHEWCLGLASRLDAEPRGLGGGSGGGGVDGGSGVEDVGVVVASGNKLANDVRFRAGNGGGS